MHQTIMLPSIRFIFNIFPVCLAPFLCSIEVGNTSQYCLGSYQMNGHNDPPLRCRFDHVMQGVSSFPNHPQSQEAELYCLRNAASAAMVQVGGWQKIAIFTKKEGQVGPR